MTFREAARDDLTAIGGLFDLEEFASEHIIDGKTVNCVIQYVSIKEASVSYGLMKATLNPKEKAVYRSDYVIHIKEEDIRPKVTPNSLINVDGKRMFIHEVRKYEGYFRIRVGETAV